MICQHEPSNSGSACLAALQALTPEVRVWLSFLLTGRGSLADLAAQCNSDLVSVAERFLAPDVQAALAAIETATVQFARLRALIGHPVALTTLAEVADRSNPNPVERRRAASTLLRASRGIAIPGDVASTGPRPVDASMRIRPTAVATTPASHLDAAPGFHGADRVCPTPTPHPDSGDASDTSSPARARDRPIHRHAA